MGCSWKGKYTDRSLCWFCNISTKFLTWVVLEDRTWSKVNARSLPRTSWLVLGITLMQIVSPPSFSFCSIGRTWKRMPVCWLEFTVGIINKHLAGCAAVTKVYNRRHCGRWDIPSQLLERSPPAWLNPGRTSITLQLSGTNKSTDFNTEIMCIRTSKAALISWSNLFAKYLQVKSIM